jgi:hypothetical protein
MAEYAGLQLDCFPDDETQRLVACPSAGLLTRPAK